MLKITLLFAGKKLSESTLAGLSEYKKRLSKSCQLNWKTGADWPDENKENATIQLVRLDRQGQSCTSPDFANQIQTWMAQGKSQLVFLIGIPDKGYQDGAPHDELDPFIGTLSLSPVALGSNTAGLLLAEQIYRSFRIMENKAYHK